MKNIKRKKVLILKIEPHHNFCSASFLSVSLVRFYRSLEAGGDGQKLDVPFWYFRTCNGQFSEEFSETQPGF
jgi:hypothetical protein